MRKLFWVALLLISFNSNAQLVSESYFDYMNMKHVKIRTRIETGDSLKIYGSPNGWKLLISFKVDSVRAYKHKDMYFFHNESGSYLIGEHLFHQRAFLIRSDTEHHLRKLIVVYYQIGSKT